MPSPFIGGRIPQELHEALQNHIAESGEKLPYILQKALSNYLSYAPPIDEGQEGLKQRVALLESSLKELREAVEQIQIEQTQREPIPTLSPEPEKEKEPIPTGQLSFLENKADNRIDNDTDNTFNIEKTEEVGKADNSTDNSSDIRPVNEEASPIETITPQEMAERSGISIRSLRNYLAQKKEVKRDGFLYRPYRSVIEGKRGEAMWIVEVIK
jgi:hypothetical protein